MYNITLVCTRHQKQGRCNSDELYRIIEAINPEVIFEEMPPSYYDKYYIDKTRSNLEADAINKYLETHRIKNIPVDSEDIPSESFLQNHEYMHKQVEGLADVNGFHYRKFIDTHSEHVRVNGFKYLNSIYCAYVNDEINDAIEKSLQRINKIELFQTYNLWKEIHEKRENEMLQNIYNYSKENSYDNAIFTIGSGHRKSIMQKIQVIEREEEFNLNWIFCNAPQTT